VVILFHALLNSAPSGCVWSASGPHGLTSGETALRHQLNRRMGGPQCLSEKCCGEKTVLLPWGIEFRTLCRRARSLVAIPTELSRPFYAQRKTGKDAAGCNNAQLNPLPLLEIWSQCSQQSVTVPTWTSWLQEWHCTVSKWPNEHRRKY